MSGRLARGSVFRRRAPRVRSLGARRWWQAFRYPVAGDVMDGKTFTYSFLRPVPPGSYRLKLVVTDPSGREVGEVAVDLSVPEVGIAFRPELAPGEADTLPEAEAIVIADEGGHAARGRGVRRIQS